MNPTRHIAMNISIAGTVAVLLFTTLNGLAAEITPVEELGFKDLRVVDGKLYEFGKYGKASETNQYFIGGSVQSSATAETVLVKTYLETRIPSEMLLGAGSSDMLRLMAVQRHIDNENRTGRVSASDFWSMSPEFRRVYMNIRDNYTARVTLTYTVRNLPIQRPGQTLNLLVLPVGDGVYDVGRRFEGDLFQFKQVLRLTPGGLVAVPLPTRDVFEAGLEKKRQAKFAFQLKQAAAGSPTFQYDLGLRYLAGDGVEKDKDKAREWLEKAAGQGHTGAKEELGKLKPSQ